MTGDFANLLLNTLIAVLLVVTIGYCWILNHRIKILQDSRGELARLLKHFDDSTKRASESIVGLQTASKKIGENIQHKIEKSNYLLDDLAYMIDKGEQVANKLEASFAVNRARDRVLAEQPQARPAAQPKPARPAPVEAFDDQPAPVRQPEKTVSSSEKTAASLEAVLERVVGRSKMLEVDSFTQEEASPAKAQPSWPRVAKAEPAASERSGQLRSRSRAEQELLDMIKTGIKG